MFVPQSSDKQDEPLAEVFPDHLEEYEVTEINEPASPRDTVETVPLRELVVIPSNRPTVTIVCTPSARASLDRLNEDLEGFWSDFAKGAIDGLFILAIIFGAGLVYSQITWVRMAQVTGVMDSAYAKRLGPTRKTIDELGHGQLHDYMGASALCLGLPITLFVPLYCSGAHLSAPYALPGLAFAICLYEIVCGTAGYFGDYYHACVDEDTPKIGTKAGIIISRESPEGAIAWWQKLWVCSIIDQIFAHINVVGLSFIGLVQLIYSPTPLAYAPLIGALYGATMYAKWEAGSCFDEYAEDQSEETLWWALFLHTMWHVGGVSLALIQVYELMTNGINLDLDPEEEQVFETDSCMA